MPSSYNDHKSTLDEKYKLVADTIRAYPLQLKQSWEEIQKMYIPDEYKNIENIVFCGMGGSALGARMLDAYAFNLLRVPLEIFNEYGLPNYTNSKSLVIVSSYSGTTEETIEATYEALKRKAKVFAITTGGKLAEIVKNEKFSGYVFNPLHNPSGQPRMSIGYASGAVLSLLTKIGVLSVSEEEIDQTISIMNNIIGDYNEGAPKGKNLAVSFAQKIRGRIPILVASEHLIGSVYTIKNQLNESAKTFAALFDIPELNHHLMEGLRNPSRLKDLFLFIFINSKLYSDRVQVRYPLTANVVEKNGIPHLMYSPYSDKKLSQLFETLIFGSYVSYYLTKAYQIDPLEIPWVDYFKKELSRV